MRRLLTILSLVALVAAGLAAGCQPQEEPAPTPGDDTAPAEKPEAEAPEPEKPEAEKPPTPDTADAEDEDWESLFDGKTLGQWKASDFWKPGKVTVEDGSIILSPGTGDLTGIFWGGNKSMLPKVDYEVRLEAQRVEGGDFFCALTFPYKDACASLVVGGWGGGVVGISSLGGFDASENETTNYMEFKNGQWYDIRLRVTEEKMEAWIDDEKVVDTEVGDRDVDVRIEVEASKPLGMAAWNTKSALRKIRLRRLLDE